VAINKADLYPVDQKGWLQSKSIAKKPSPYFNQRPNIAGTVELSLIVIHNISLPAGEFGTPYIQDLFLGCLDCKVHPSFESLQGLEVSSHFVIDRLGQLSQYVSCYDRAWHAGLSSWQGRDNCNDFSIGIELEGSDDIAYSDAQYQVLAQLVASLQAHFNMDKSAIAGHSDIAPGRKTDPGPSFDWQRLQALLT